MFFFALRVPLRYSNASEMWYKKKMCISFMLPTSSFYFPPPQIRQSLASPFSGMIQILNSWFISWILDGRLGMRREEGERGEQSKPSTLIEQLLETQHSKDVGGFRWCFGRHSNWFPPIAFLIGSKRITESEWRLQSPAKKSPISLAQWWCKTRCRSNSI